MDVGCHCVNASRLLGSEGSLSLDDPWDCRHPAVELHQGNRVDLIDLDPVDSYRLELENVSGPIRGAAPLLLGRTDAVAQSHAVASLHHSAVTGLPGHLT